MGHLSLVVAHLPNQFARKKRVPSLRTTYGSAILGVKLIKPPKKMDKPKAPLSLLNHLSGLGKFD